MKRQSIIAGLLVIFMVLATLSFVPDDVAGLTGAVTAAECKVQADCTTCCDGLAATTAEGDELIFLNQVIPLIPIITTQYNDRKAALEAKATRIDAENDELIFLNQVVPLIPTITTQYNDRKSALSGKAVAVSDCKQQCTVPVQCGNGQTETGEACDDGNTVTETQCTTYGGTGSFCNAGCSAAITLACPRCGDNAIQSADGEVCDGTAVGTLPQCTVEGSNYNGEQRSCNAQCSGYEPQCTAIESCGDGVKNGNEACDDGTQNGQPNKCDAQCTGTTAPVCGNSFIEAGETCDLGADNTAQCTTYGGTCCSTACQALPGPSCGDGTVTAPNEVCDPNSANAVDKQRACVPPDPNGYEGTQLCNAQCNYQNVQCITSQSCGDNTKNGNELCDGGALGGVSCQTVPNSQFSGGSLQCVPSTAATGKCTFDTSQCTYTLTLTKTEPAVENPPADANGVPMSSPPTGTVSATPPGANCDASGCDYTQGTPVRLGASTTQYTPGTFTGWSGVQCTEAAPTADSCTVIVNAPTTVTAGFTCVQGQYRGMDENRQICNLANGCKYAQQCVVETNIFKWKEVAVR